jgi:8-oxo-dGTP pyrophosphatase MutT (NUDIX family)
VSKLKSKIKLPGRRRHQYAALPIRFTGAGKLQVLLLTSRGTRRWVIPKGWPIPKLSPGAAAVREAYEEAGLEGAIESETPIGHYHYDKGLGGGGAARVQVGVFLLRVSRQLQAWPEQAERETHWYDPDEAAGLVEEPELAAILRDLRALVCAAQ